ncbi:MAG: glycosyltransferase family 2 protein [Firmicutes bacterium]|nr:glycosyltransferase family 2 protein [Bacillota bacterium]
MASDNQMIKPQKIFRNKLLSYAFGEPITERQKRRIAQTDELIDSLALKDFEDFYSKASLPEVVIVIAAYKEADNIGHVLTTLPKTVCGLSTKAIVVTDGEEDGTTKIVREMGHYGISAPVNRGQGAALRLGYRVARNYGATYIITADADGQSDPNDFEAMLTPLAEGKADFVNGSRRLGTTASKDVVRNSGVIFFGYLISVLTGTKVTDTANPMRAMRASLTEKFTLSEHQFQASELLISAIMSGVTFTEVPINMKARASGHSKKGSNLTYALNYFRVVIRSYVREKKGLTRAQSAKV